MSTENASANPSPQPDQQRHRTYILRVLPDHEANSASYVVKSLPNNKSQLFRSLADALKHIQISVQQQ